MKKILGLDLGTSSIGWAVVNQAENKNEKSSIVKLGVRVNPLTVDEKGNFEAGKSITTTADRTLKRGMRRNLQRYKQRRDNLISIFKAESWITDNTILSEDGKHTTFETLRLRAKAAKEEVTLEQFARILLMINKKRGYKSNRKAQGKEEDGELIDGMAIARKLYKEHLTPGEYTYQLLQTGKRFIPSFYPSDLAQEFNAVWNLQKQFYPEILTDEIKRKIENKGKKDSEKLFYDTYRITTAEVKDKSERLITLYRWRAQASHGKLEIEQVVAVLASIKGAIAGSSGYLGQISDHSKELFFNKMTVGEYLMKQVSENPHFRTKNIVFYRQDYLDEFETLWETQKKFHPELTDKLKKEIRDVVIFYQRKLKSQKGLIAFCEFEGKKIKVRVNGKEKTVMTGPRVCPKSSPLFQESKIWQAINNLEITSKHNLGGLFRENKPVVSPEQKQKLHDELSVNKTLKTTAIFKVLGIKAKDYSINYSEMSGNSTQATLMAAYKKILEWSGHDVDNFDKLNANEKMNFIEQVFTALGAKTDFLRCDEEDIERSPMFRLWHLLYSYEGDSSATGTDGLVRHIMELTGLSREYAIAIAQVNFASDYGSLSSKAIKKILPFLRNGLRYSEACETAGYKHSKSSLTKEEIESKVLEKHLDVLPKNSLRNPVVEKILNQMVHVVNGAMTLFGPFDEVHIELARELKQSKQQREKATRRLNERTRESKDIAEILKGEPFFKPHPTRNDIIRYRLYKELEPNGFKTLYTNTYISKDMLFSRDFDIEHIIPQAKLFDDSFTNKTIETRAANIEKSDKTAYDYVLGKYGKENISAYMERVENVFGNTNPGKAKKLKTTEEDIPGDFLNRDLSDSQYIARKAKKMLENISPVVISTTGSITARLREDWQLIDVMKELNWDKYDRVDMTEKYRNEEGHEVKRIKDWTKRNDHRHHAMDALTIALTRLSHIQFLNNLNARGQGRMPGSVYGILKKELTENGKFKAPIPLSEFREEAKRHLEAILVSIKAKNKVATSNANKVKGSKKVQIALTPRDQLHNETVYGKRRRYETKKEKVGSGFTESKILTVANRAYREALLRRLQEFGDPKKAFTGKNSLEKNPLFINSDKTKVVPTRVKTVEMEEYYTIRKEINNDLKIDKVVDTKIRDILTRRIAKYGDANKAFANLADNPIWFNKDAGITIKRVTVKGVNVATPLHKKRNKDGVLYKNNEGEHIPTDYVSTSNNHHIAIFEDADGNLQEHVVSFYEAMTSMNSDLPVIDKHYNQHLGWKFLFTMKQNEYFVVPDIEHGFNPIDYDLQDPHNYPIISKHLFRVQKLATKDYFFRHHLETTVAYSSPILKKLTWLRVNTVNGLRGFIKVRVNHNGEIDYVGEY